MAKQTAPEQLPSLELTTFGAPAVQVAGGRPAPEVEWRKNLALVVYLALSPSCTRTRSQLIGLLWPDNTERKARHSLNEAVRRLRSALGAGRLVSTGAGENLTLAQEGLWIDALEFDRCFDTDRARALALWRGDFLDGFSLDDADVFGTWLQGRRQHYRQRAADLLLETGADALATSRYADAVSAARSVLQLRPFSEPAMDLLLRALALDGDATGALAAYATFAAGTERDLHEQPARPLRDLADRIRSGQWRRVTPSYADTDPPLLGRATQYRRAFDAVTAAAADGPSALAILGEPGQGRTRLLAECTTRFALQGGVVAVARPMETDHDAPWSTLRALVRNGLGDAPGVAATAPAQLAVLAALAPEIAPHATPVEPRDTAEVARALAELLGAVADEQPILLAVDDAHFADRVTLGALHGALTQLRGVPVFCVVTCLHDAHDPPRELVRLRGEVGRAIAGQALRLEPFTADELGELVVALEGWCEDDTERERLTRRIAHESGGNPFLAVTLLRGLEHAVTLREDIRSWPQADATLDAPLPISVPDLARMAIVANLSALDAPVRDVAAAASVLDQGVNVPLLSHVVDRPADAVEEALATLERQRLLTFDGTRYAFAARLTTAIVRHELLTSGARRRLRGRALELLAERDDLESRVLCARLTAENTPGRATAEAAGRIVMEALQVGAFRTARRAAAAASRAVRQGDAGDAAYVSSLYDTIRAQETAPERS